MRDQILCATDFSESSVQSLKWANKIALGTGAHLSILYSYRLIQTGKTADVLSFKRKTEEEANLKYLEIEKTVFTEPTASKTFITEIGFFSDNIENFVRKNPSTLVVMSACLAEVIYDHRNQTLEHFLQSLEVPLLVVPHSNPEQIRTLVIDRQSVKG